MLQPHLFSQGASQVIADAGENARNLGQNQLSAAHLLAGILASEGQYKTFLERAGVTEVEVHQLLVRQGAGTAFAEDFEYLEDYMEVLLKAQDLAQSDESVLVQHLVLAILLVSDIAKMFMDEATLDLLIDEINDASVISNFSDNERPAEQAGDREMILLLRSIDANLKQVLELLSKA